MTSFEVYILKSIPEKPLMLSHEKDSHIHHTLIKCGQQDFILIFARGKWDKSIPEYCAELSCGDSLFKLGTITENSRSLYWCSSQWDKLVREGIRKGNKNQFTIQVKPTWSMTDAEDQRFTGISSKVDNVIVAGDLPSHDKLDSEVSEKTTATQDKEEEKKKGRRKNCMKENEEVSTLDVNVTPSNGGVKRALVSRRLRMSEKKAKVNQEGSTTVKQVTSKCSTYVHSKDSPSARWGHTLCLVGNKSALLIGGQGPGQIMARDSIWRLDTDALAWSVPECDDDPDKPQNRMGHTATYDGNTHTLYVFGGSKNLIWFKDVHILDLKKEEWSFVETNGVAPTRAYHSCTLFRNELYVFGGVFPNPGTEPDGCSNQLDIYSPATKGWYQPVVLGKKPKPRSGHSASLLGNQLVIFGGWDAPVCFNDVHVLDLGLMEFSSPDVSGTPPSPRSWHAACVLPDEEILIHGGYDGNNALGDAFILSLSNLSWRQVELESKMPIGPRAGHTLLITQAAGMEESKILLFGGGDNEDSFYQDLFEIEIRG